MGYNPWDFDDPIQRMMREMDSIRRHTESLDAIRRAQGDLNWMRETDVVGEIRRQLEGQPGLRWQLTEGRELLQELQARHEIYREIEEGQSIYRQIAGASEGASLQAAGMEDILSRHRELIDSYVFGTFYGGGGASLGASTGSTSFQERNEELAEKYAEVRELQESEEGNEVPPSATVEAFASAEVAEELSAKEEGEEGEQEAERRETRRKLRKELQQEGVQQLRPALEAVDPRLVRLWEGSNQALSSSNPDKLRHYSASRRELTTQVIHLLAPDDAVRQWSDEPSLYHDGRPTRRARLRYICRSIDQEPFNDFMVIDYSLMLETYDVFQKGTHALEPDFTPEQLSALSTRADRFLLMLLRLGGKGTGRG
ncbi:MAG TPA: hypothetical protein VF789_03600 [Thermoanaerobaculia bacterium]